MCGDNSKVFFSNPFQVEEEIPFAFTPPLHDASKTRARFASQLPSRKSTSQLKSRGKACRSGMPKVGRRQRHSLDMGQVTRARAESGIANLCTTGASAALTEHLLRVASVTAEMKGEPYSKVAKTRTVDGYAIRRSCNKRGGVCFNFRAPSGETYSSLPTMAAQEIELEQQAHEPTRLCWENTTFIQMEPMSEDGSVAPAPVKSAVANPKLNAGVLRAGAHAALLHSAACQTTTSATVVVVTHKPGQGPTDPCALDKMQDCAVGGSTWGSRDRPGRFDWVCKGGQLYRHEAPEPLIIASNVEGTGALRVLLVKGSDFRLLFDIGSPERERLREWERAAPMGAQALLNVRLGKRYTLRTALKADSLRTNHILRHGTFHVWWELSPTPTPSPKPQPQP